MDNSISLFSMASEWMENGNINEFVRDNQDVNRFELVGSSSPLPLLSLMTVPDSSKTLQRD